MADGSIKIGVDIDEKGFGKELKGLETQAKGMASNISNALSKAFKGFSVAIASVGTALGGLGLAVAKVGKDFEAQMSKVEAISGSTAEEMERLEAKAKELGATTQFSATEAGQALEYMALAGFKTEDMLDSLPGLMDLAAASGEDLALVSSILTGGLSAFGLSAKEAGRFADVLASASSNSNTNVAMLGESFKYVAPLAGALGFSIEDTATALGLMANANIQASQAGTSLRAILSNLTSTSKPVVAVLNELGVTTTTVSGEVLPLNNILQQLRESFSGLSEAQQAQYAKTLAGADGMSGLLAIVNASEADFNKLSGAINNSAGTAGEMAKIMNDNLEGAIKDFKSAVEGLALTIYNEIKEPLKETVQTITEFVRGLQTAYEEGGLQALLIEFKEKILELFPVLQPVVILAEMLGNAIKFLGENMDVVLPIVSALVGAMIAYKASMLIASVINGVVNAINFFKTAVEGATIAQKLLNLAMSANPFILVATVIGTLVGAIVTLWKTNKNFRDAILGYWQTIIQVFQNAKNNISGLINVGIEVITNFIKGMFDSIPRIVEVTFNIIKVLINTFIKLSIRLLAVGVKFIAQLIVGLVKAIPTLLKSVLEIGKSIVKGIWNGIKSGTKGLINNIKSWAIMIKNEIQKAFTGKGGAEVIPPAEDLFALAKERFSGELLTKDLFEDLDLEEAFEDIASDDILKSMADSMSESSLELGTGITENLKSSSGAIKATSGEIGEEIIEEAVESVEEKAPELVEALASPYEIVEGMLSSGKNPFTNAIVSSLEDTVKQAKEEATSFQEIGDIITKSMSEGIKTNKDEILNASSKQLDDLLNQNLNQIEKNGKKLIEAEKQRVEKEYQQLKKTSKEKADVYKASAENQIKAYTESINAEVDSQKDALKNTADELTEVFKKSIEQNADAMDSLISGRIGDLAKEYQSKFDEIISQQEKLASTLAGGNLFGFEKDDEDKTKVIIEDIDETINKLEEYDKAITALKEKNISDAILGELSKYDTDEALQITGELLKMSDQEFDQLNKKWQQKQELAKQVASNFYKEQLDTLQTEFNQKLTDTINKLPEELENIGVMTIEGFAEGINSKKDNILKETEQFASQVITTMQKALDIHSPSKKTKWLGEMLDKGLSVGIKKGEKGIIRTIDKMNFLDAFNKKMPQLQASINAVNRGMIPVSSARTINTNSTKNITNNQGDFVLRIDNFNAKNKVDIETLLTEASFYQKQRDNAIGVVT